MATTRSLSVPPLTSEVTEAMPADLEALASRSSDAPDTVAPFEGMSIAVVGRWLFAMIVIGALVTVLGTASVAFRSRITVGEEQG